MAHADDPRPTVLMARVQMQVSAGAQQRLERFLAALTPLHREAAAAGVHELLIGREAVRHSRLAPEGGKGKPARALFSVVTHADGGLQWWDHTSKTQAQLGSRGPEGTALPKPRLQPPAGLAVVMPDAKAPAGRRTREATISYVDARLGRVRQRLVFARAEAGRKPGAGALLLARPLLEAVIGCSECHGGAGIPVARLAELGWVERVESWFDDDDAKTPAIVTLVERLGERAQQKDDFEPPSGYRPMGLEPRAPRKPPAAPKPRPLDLPRPGTGGIDGIDGFGGRDPIEPPVPPGGGGSGGIGGTGPVGRKEQGLEGDVDKNAPTPECLPSTRLGAQAALVRQTLFDHAATAVNDLLPLAGTGTLAGGRFTLPWLAALGAAAPAAPGSGLFSFLREPRNATTGGRGLLDRLAWLAFSQRDAAGKTLTEQAFDAGTLPATLAGWGVSAATAAALDAAAGLFTALSAAQQIEVLEAYETTVWGTLTLSGLPTALPAPTATNAAPWTTPPELAGLMSFRLTAIAGTVGFTPGSPVLPTLSIGSAGNVVARVALPAITFTCTVSRRMTLLGWVLLVGGAVAACALFPLACPTFVVLAALVAFVANNVTALTVVATGVTLDYDLRWRHEPAQERVLPVVRLTGNGGTLTVTNRWVTPNLIANLFDSLVTGLGNLFNAWVPLAGELGRLALQRLLRDSGVALPAGAEFGALRALAGEAVSGAGERLILSAVVDVRDRTQAQPFATQAATRPTLVRQLDDLSAVMQRDLNPPPTGPLDAVASHGCYLGLAYNQNALNGLLFRRWQQRAFELDLTGAEADALGRLVPPAFMRRTPSRVHVWCAVPPRLVLSEEGLMAGERALFAFFDDVRVCFEARASGADAERPGGGVLLELSFDAKMPASLTLDWPMVSRGLFSLRRFEPSDLRAWELTDPNQPVPNPWPGMAAFQPVAEKVLDLLLAGAAAAPLTALVPAASAWGRRLPHVQEALGTMPNLGPLVNRLWLELLGGRRALYAMPVLQSVLLQLVDGSGAPVLQLAGIQTPATLGTLTAAEGVQLRTFLAFMADSQFP